MASIRKRLTLDGKIRYEVQVRLKGSAPEVATFRRIADAQRWAQKRETAIRERRHFGGAEARHRTVEELVERYVETSLPSLAATEQSRRAAMLRWWVEQIGVLKLAEVTPAVISEQRDLLAKRVSPARQNRYLAALSRCFSLAVREWHWCETNPVSMVGRRRERRAGGANNRQCFAMALWPPLLCIQRNVVALNGRQSILQLPDPGAEGVLDGTAIPVLDQSVSFSLS